MLHQREVDRLILSFLGFTLPLGKETKNESVQMNGKGDICTGKLSLGLSLF